jgi:hypothetical protein
MPRFSLRTLILLMMLGGPALAGMWWLVTTLGEWAALPLLAGLSVLITLVLCRNSSLKTFAAVIYYQLLGAVVGYLLWDFMLGSSFGTPGGNGILFPAVAAVVGEVISLVLYRRKLEAIAVQK